MALRASVSNTFGICSGSHSDRGLGSVAALDCAVRKNWIVDGHRDDGKRFVVHADDKLTAFLEFEAAIVAGHD